MIFPISIKYYFDQIMAAVLVVIVGVAVENLPEVIFMNAAKLTVLSRVKILFRSAYV